MEMPAHRHASMDPAVARTIAVGQPGVLRSFPSGFILHFEPGTQCPSGWTRCPEWDADELVAMRKN